MALSYAVFRSAIDSWAISQVFPVMPIHRLEQARSANPSTNAMAAVRTCVSNSLELARVRQMFLEKPH